MLSNLTIYNFWNQKNLCLSNKQECIENTYKKKKKSALKTELVIEIKKEKSKTT